MQDNTVKTPHDLPFPKYAGDEIVIPNARTEDERLCDRRPRTHGSGRLA